MSILEVRVRRPLGTTPVCPPGQIFDYTLNACRDAQGAQPGDGTVRTVATIGGITFLVLGLLGAGLTTYFVWRVAKKQRWV